MTVTVAGFPSSFGKACEEIFDNLFSQPVPREANGGFLVAPERTLGAAWLIMSPHSQC